MSKTEQSNGFLSELRRVVWPIESHELKKFLPMAGMMFFILFNYSMLRSIKDGFVLDDIGAEAISFLKTYVVLPSAVIAMIIYAKLCNALTPQKVFYAVTGFFVAYLTFFAFVLNLHPDFGHPTEETIERLSALYPNFKWFIRIVGNWGVASFYAMAELWGSMMLSLLFWQFANQITRTSEAKRFYSMFGLLGNFALPIVGLILGGFLGDNAPEYFKTHLTPFTPVLSICIVNGLIVMVLYSWTNNNVLTDPALYDPSARAAKKSKAKLSLGESFKLIFSSKYLGLIATLILAYGVSINLVEGVWKSKLKEMYHTKEAITAYMGQFQIYTGIGAIAFMIIGSNILRRVSWSTAAMITPAMILVTGGVFFGFIFFDQEMAAYLIGISPLAAAVTMGMLQNVLSKATKYSLFDSTKEMTYIPLDDELKSKGKAAVDVVGGRLGKSGGGIIQSTFFMLIPTFTFVEATPYFAGIFFVIVILWLYAVKALNHEYQNQIKDHSY